MSKPYNFDCKTCFTLLDDFVDRNLTENEVQEVNLHLEHCPPCAKFFSFEESVLKFIGKRLCEEKDVPKDLFKKICQGLPED